MIQTEEQVDDFMEKWEADYQSVEDWQIIECAEAILDLDMVDAYAGFLSSTESVWEDEVPELERQYTIWQRRNCR